MMVLQLPSGGNGSCCSSPWSLSSLRTHQTKPITNTNPSFSLSSTRSFPAVTAVGMLAAAVVLSTPAPSEETLSNIPQLLSGESCEDTKSGSDCNKAKGRIQRPKSRKAESCTSKCVATCVRGDDEGPLNIRRPSIVFKQGFRSRQYCLVECSDVCNLLDSADKGR